MVINNNKNNIEKTKLVLIFEFYLGLRTQSRSSERDGRLGFKESQIFDLFQFVSLFFTTSSLARNIAAAFGLTLNSRITLLA